MRRFHRSRALGGLFATVLLLTACGGAAAKPTTATGRSTTAATSTGTVTSTTATSSTTQTNVFRFAAQYQPNTMDPAAAQTVLELQLLSLVYDRLFTYHTAAMTIKDQLAQSYAWSTDGKTLTVKLKPNIHFSNGDLLTAQDVAFSIQRNLVPATKSVYAASYFGLVGAKAFYAGKAKTVPGLDVVSPTEIKFKLTQPEPYFINVLGLQNSMILDHRLPAGTTSVSSHPVGTGPYILKSWVQNESMTFVRNPKYDLGPPASIAKVHVTFGPTPNLQVLQFEKGQLDAVYFIPSSQYLSVINNPKLKQDYVQVPVPSINFVHMNPKVVPQFANVKVRQALNYAINKKAIIRSVWNGRGSVANGPLPPGIPGYDASLKPYPYDVATAKKLLTEAGYPHGFSVAFDYSATPTNKKLAEALQSQLAQVGVKLTLNGMTSPVYRQLYLKNQVPFGFGNWLLDYPDGEDFLYLLLDGHSPLNRFNYDDPTFDNMVQHADSITNQPERVKLFTEASVRAHQQAPWIFLRFGTVDGLFQPWVQPHQPKLLLNPVLYTVWTKIHMAKH